MSLVLLSVHLERFHCLLYAGLLKAMNEVPSALWVVYYTVSTLSCLHLSRLIIAGVVRVKWRAQMLSLT